MLTTHTLDCPYCGEPLDLVVDASAGSQRYIEDCAVCCRPMTVIVEVHGDDEDDVVVHVQSEDEV